MLNTLYNFEADSLFELVPALDGLFSYNEIMNFDVDQYYKNFVTAELKWRLLDSFLPFIQCPNIHLEDDFEITLNNFFNYSVRYAYFDAEELREIFKTAVKYKISAIFQPVELLNLHFFTNNYIITKAELFIKKDYFLENSIAKDIASNFFIKFDSNNNLELINRSDFRKFINNYNSTLIENSKKLENHLNYIRSYLGDFSLELNILTISQLFYDLNINYIADKLRINFKDDYVPNNQIILTYLENDELIKGDLNEALDDIIYNDDVNELPQILEQEILEVNKRSVFNDDDGLDILDDIIDEVSELTSKEIDKNIDQNIEFELDLSNDSVQSNMEQNDVNFNNVNRTLNTTNDDLDLDQAINSELKSIMDIINL